MASRELPCMRRRKIGYVGWGQLFWCAQTLFVSLYLDVLWTSKRDCWEEVLSSSLPPLSSSCFLPLLFPIPSSLLLVPPPSSLIFSSCSLSSFLYSSFCPSSFLSPSSSPWWFPISLPPTLPLLTPPSPFFSSSFSYPLLLPLFLPLLLFFLLHYTGVRIYSLTSMHTWTFLCGLVTDRLEVTRVGWLIFI